jgi:hypothetical protein
MVLAALLVVCSIPQMDDTAKAANSSTVVAELSNSSAEPAANNSNNSKEAAETAALPSAPTPKVKTDAEMILPAPSAQPIQPVKPVLTRPRETPRQRIMWYGLAAAGSAGAAFDAWSTRRAISGGYGQEANPFLRPFANSNALYAVMQVSPAVMDFIGKRMMVSEHPLLRKMWWVPQTVGASFSFAAGAHNVGVVH